MDLSYDSVFSEEDKHMLNAIVPGCPNPLGIKPIRRRTVKKNGVITEEVDYSDKSGQYTMTTSNSYKDHKSNEAKIEHITALLDAAVESEEFEIAASFKKEKEELLNTSK